MVQSALTNRFEETQMFSPPLGRFLSRDPLPRVGEPDVFYDNNWFGRGLTQMRMRFGGGIATVARYETASNRYVYCRNSPTGLVDPRGLQALTLGAPAAAGAFDPFQWSPVLPDIFTPYSSSSSSEPAYDPFQFAPPNPPDIFLNPPTMQGGPIAPMQPPPSQSPMPLSGPFECPRTFAPGDVIEQAIPIDQFESQQSNNREHPTFGGSRRGGG
jgi:hypothetical protein